ncbi:MAG: YgjV family protein [Lactobacillales bacterium]|nr:YgjV family protein [Lactobacillales bacterium]
MEILVILAQVAAIIGWLLLVYSYYKNDIDELLFVQIISSIFYCISYFLLGATSGLIVCFIELLKCIGYYKTDKDNFIFLITLPIYILISIFTYDGFISLLPIIGSLIDGFSLTKNKNVATIGSIISNMLWLIYDIIILAFVAALTDGVLVVSNCLLLLFGYSRLIKTNKLTIILSRGFNKNIHKAIHDLDVSNYGEEYTWSFDYEKNINNKNNDSMLIIKYNNNIVGYLNYFVLSENEYLKIINSEEIVKEYDLNNIIKYRKNRKNYLVIDSINIKSQFQNHVSVDLIIKKLKKIIRKKHNEGYKIESIISVAFNKFEENVLKQAGFDKYKEYSNKESLYVIDRKNIEDIYLKNMNNKSDYKTYQNEQIKDEMLKEIRILDEKFFGSEYLWDEDYQLQLFNKNKDSMIIVNYKNKLVGYLNYLVITEDKYNEMLNSNVIIDSFNIDEVTPFYKSKKNYLTINSVVIDRKFQNGYVIKLLTRRLKKILKQKKADKYRIAGINAIAVSEDGKKILEYLGFIEYKVLDDGNHLYVLEGKNLKKYLS